MDTSAVGTAVASMSFWDMFLTSDFLIKGVILILALCSVWGWAVIFGKYISIKNLNRRSSKFEDAFWSGESLDKLYDRLQSKQFDPMTVVFCVGMKEWRRGHKHRAGEGTTPHVGLLQRVDRVMSVAIGREMSRAERYMTFLASVGSVAPFLGLFGTVWGIMNAFASIAGSGNTNIAVVAPGIAEALSTTALGLIAAIPAVVAYNKFSTDLARYGARLEAFAAEFSSILARYLEEISTASEDRGI